jgi:hypothetical protein
MQLAGDPLPFFRDSVSNLGIYFAWCFFHCPLGMPPRGSVQTIASSPGSRAFGFRQIFSIPCSKMLDQETGSSRPRDFPGRAVTAYFRAVQKRAPGIGAGVKLMQLLELRQLRADMGHVFGWRRRFVGNLMRSSNPLNPPSL